ncbi:4528_t:CDS:10 [Diversispora eburnea]|uniref:4528_t:CDS:1 n=1 Tax=Diversispora eburnea TaxID=1213867 RepID=A0A9N8ZDK9_9GLOM|nr:4528_t:CDS:10 [Diversispora eburnea]
MFHDESSYPDEITSNESFTTGEGEIEPILTDNFAEETISEIKDSQIPENEHLILSHQVRHQVALPPNYPYIPISQHAPPSEPARTYPFELDPFQKVAIASIERSESILVSAHTSAGKTVIAEYAIAKSLRDRQRVIYTSPIKALSNQKFRELEAAFGDVGLITGDTTINPNAISWVIFDEIHYMRDKVRGVVWEETIILLPHQIHFIFLSATIPNAMEFAEWICKIHAQPCHVVYTDFRPTPLQHYIYPCGGEGIYQVVDELGIFKESSFLQATRLLVPESIMEYNKKADDKLRYGPSDIIKIVSMIMQRDYLPVIIFSFGKRECGNLAHQLKDIDVCTEKEKPLVQTVINNALQIINPDDRQLAQIEDMLPLLIRGIAVHHSGLLPILKEIVELLFQEGLIKVLFATETFSMGLNMPARTVVFSDVKKFDGQNLRYISAGEYIQMSGRAGRRSIDNKGIVILMAKQRMEPSVIKSMIFGESDYLQSAFHLKYHMILNMTRVEGLSPESILKKSFYQFQNSLNLPRLEEEKKYDSLIIPNQKLVAEYYDSRQLLDAYFREMQSIINHPFHILPFLKPGRLVRIKHANMDFGWGMVVRYGIKNVGLILLSLIIDNNIIKFNIKEKTSTQENKINNQINNQINIEPLAPDDYFVDVLIYCDSNSIVAKTADGITTGVRPCYDDTGEAMVVPVELSAIQSLSAIRIFSPKSFTFPQVRQTVYDSIQNLIEKFPNGLIPLDPIEDMAIKDESFLKLIRKIEILEDKTFFNPLHNNPYLPVLYNRYAKKVSLRNRIKQLKKKIKISQSILHLDELKYRKRVLHRIGYLTEDDIITLKGRVACEINVGDELVLTEMLLNGVFNDLSVEMTAALLSCFVFERKDNKQQNRLKEEFTVVFRRLQEIARNIAAISIECKLQIIEEEYLDSFCPDLMEVVYAWCQGQSFADVMKLADTYYEGQIIRILRNLDELLRALISANKIIGNLELENQIENEVKAAICELHDVDILEFELPPIKAKKRDKIFEAKLLTINCSSSKRSKQCMEQNQIYCPNTEFLLMALPFVTTPVQTNPNPGATQLQQQ